MDVSRSQALSTSNRDSVPTDDAQNPYFLHHTDSPGLVLVSQQLTGDNYASWSRAMLIALSVKNKIGFVNGSIPRPDGNDPSLLNSWIRNNNIVISWILNSVSKEISASIIFSESASEIWSDLRDRFQQSNGPRIFQLRREIINHCQNQTSVSVYFTKLKALWEELNNFRPGCSCGKCTCGGVKELNNYYHTEYVMSFLMGLNESFAQVRGQLLLMDPMPPINKVFSLISQEERQRSISTQMNSDANLSVAFAAKGESQKNFTEGTEVASSNGNRNSDKERPLCTHCNLRGHTIDRCYKLHGYPPGTKPNPSGIKPKFCYSSNNSSTAVANQVCDGVNASNEEKGNISSFLQGLSNNQCNQLMTILSTHMASATKVEELDCSGGNSAASVNNDQMSMEDSMAEDIVQATPPATPVFGQQPIPPQSNFVFGASAPSGVSPFQFGGQQNIAPQNPSPYRASGSLEFNAGGSFSLGTSGGDKSGRKYVKVKHRPRKK